jgi:hypothetical protein
MHKGNQDMKLLEFRLDEEDAASRIKRWIETR